LSGDRLADALAGLLAGASGVSMRTGLHTSGGLVDFGDGVATRIALWAAPMPADGARVVVLIQRGMALGIGVV